MKVRDFFASRQFNYIFSALAIVAMWAVWLIAYAVVGNDYIVPSFSDTMRRLGELFTESFFWRSFGMTLLRAVEGWAIAFACAVIGVALIFLLNFIPGVNIPIVWWSALVAGIFGVVGVIVLLILNFFLF